MSRLRFWADISYRMLRLRTVLVMITFQAIGYEAAGPAAKLSPDFFLGAIMIAALYMSATCFNDISDVEVDKVNLANDRSRPLVSKDTTVRQLKILGLAALVIAALAAIIISPAYLGFVIAGILLSVLYSLPPVQISHRGILASLWLPLSYVVLPFCIGAHSLKELDSTGIYILVAMYMCFVGRILLKDFRDYEGDKKFGKLNFLVRHGPKTTCIASAAAWVAGDMVFIWSLSDEFLTLVILAQPIIAVILFGLYRLANEKNYTKKLLQVLFIGRMGNALALSLLSALSLQAFDYSDLQKDIIVVAIGVFMSASAMGLWRDEALQRELLTKR